MVYTVLHTSLLEMASIRIVPPKDPQLSYKTDLYVIAHHIHGPGISWNHNVHSND